jgi:hypothetical protein
MKVENLIAREDTTHNVYAESTVLVVEFAVVSFLKCARWCLWLIGECVACFSVGNSAVCADDA